MRRLDWQLVRPRRVDGDVQESLTMAEMIRRLVTREAAGELSDEDRTLLNQVEDAYEEGTKLHCHAVEAPFVRDDPHWESRLVDEYDVSDVDIELEDYLSLRKAEPDCEQCPYASPYSLYPMDPCEFSAGVLEHVLADPKLQEQASRPMPPSAMRAYAADLEAALRQGRWRRVETVDAEDYLAKTVHWLRFWADHGFGVLPTDIDELLDLQSDVGAPLDADDEAGPTTYH